jgi:hypothetical protein
MVAKVAHLVEVRYRGQEDPLDVEPGQEPKGVGNPPAGASVEDEDVAELREMEDEALAHEGQARGEDIVQHPVALESVDQPDAPKAKRGAGTDEAVPEGDLEAALETPEEDTE